MPYEKLGEQYEFTTPAQLYYARGLFEATAMPGVANAEEKYNAWFIIERSSPDFQALVALIRTVGGFKLKTPVKLCQEPLTKAEKDDMQLRYTTNPGYSHPLWSGDRVIANAQAAGKSVENLTHLAGKYILTGRSGKDYPPRLGGLINNVGRDFDGSMRDAQRAQFYNGALVYPKVYLRVYEAFGGGISCRISSVFSMNDGDRLAGGEGAQTAIPATWSPKHSGQDTAVDPFDDDFGPKADDDEIPF